MQYALRKVQCVGKAEAAFNIRLNDHKKYISNTKFISTDLHFRKPGHSFSLHVNFYIN